MYTAFAPSHITGLFAINHDNDPLKEGSRGAGVSLELGVYTTVKSTKSLKWKAQIRINKMLAKAEVSQAVIKKFSKLTSQAYDISIDHHIEVPVGAGFGVSGAGALSLALALNEELNVGLSRIEVAQIAHLAEINRGTGLGTVLAATFGGLEIREKPGAPGIGTVKTISNPDGKVISLCLGSLATKKFLRNTAFQKKVNAVGNKLIGGLILNFTSSNFLLFSRKFADKLNLYTQRLERILRNLGNQGLESFSMNFFGEALFTIVKEENQDHILQNLKRFSPLGGTLVVSSIDKYGARLVD
ncbi:MAG: hypothetical protein ABIH76_08965 [Candidatus Bathyarchaeota archaeon]